MRQRCIFPLFRAELRMYITGGDRYVFPEHAALYKTRSHVLRQRIGQIFDKAGIVRYADREHGVTKASVRDFHSFRTTWITLALSSGVPMELVRRVTGHATVDVVLKHYFRPGRADFKKALEAHMPPMLVGGKHSRKSVSPTDNRLAQVRALLERQNNRNWKTVRDEALAALEGTQ